MFVSINARLLLNAWRSFCRGKGVDPPATDEAYILCEYASEKMGKRDYNKVVGDYFSASGSPNLSWFARSVGVSVDRVDEKRVAAEQLYLLLCRDLYVTDWPSMKMFLTEDLYTVGLTFLVIAPAAIEQCVQYGGRHWAYFRRVAEQALAVAQCEDAMEEDRLSKRRLPVGYFDNLDAIRLHNDEMKRMRAEVDKAIEDQVIGRANAKEI